MPPSVGRCFAVPLAVILAAGGCTPDPGRLAFEPQDLDVSADESHPQEQEVTVVLRNVGGGPLDIAELRPSCSCTVMQALEATHLEKNAAITIKLRVSPPAVGNSDVMVVAQAALSEAPPAVLSLHLHGSSEVPRLFSATREVAFVGTTPIEELTGVVELLTDESATAPAWVTALQSSSPAVTTELVERKGELRVSEDVVRCSYVFVVHGSTPERGTTRSELTIQTSFPPANQSNRLPRIQVTRQFSRVVRAVPSELIFRKRGQNPRVQCRLAVVPDDEIDFEVAFDQGAGWFSVSAEPALNSSPGHRRTLLVEIDTDKCPTSADGEALPTIVLSTTHPKCKELRVPVHVLVE